MLLLFEYFAYRVAQKNGATLLYSFELQKYCLDLHDVLQKSRSFHSQHENISY